MEVIVQVMLTLEENATLERNISVHLTEMLISASVLGKIFVCALQLMKIH